MDYYIRYWLRNSSEPMCFTKHSGSMPVPHLGTSIFLLGEVYKITDVIMGCSKYNEIDVIVEQHKGMRRISLLDMVNKIRKYNNGQN